MDKISVRFVQTIVGIEDTTGYIHMEKHIELPFIPFIGLEIFSEDFMTLEPVRRIVWQPEVNQFRACCPDDLSLNKFAGLPSIDKLDKIEELIHMYEDYGWNKAIGK